MILPVVIFYLLFMYKPMYGVIIAFMDYAPAKGIWGSKWVGFKHFERFFTGPYFGRLLRNTLLLSLYSILFCFTFWVPFMKCFLMMQRLYQKN